MVYGIRIKKDSVYGIWYKDSEGFSICYMVSGFRTIQYYVVYGIMIQKDSVYCICYKDSDGFSIWYMV